MKVMKLGEVHMKINGDVLRQGVQKALMIVLIILILFMLFYIERFSKVGRLINYSGYARGATQRIVKLELVGRSDPELFDRINKIIDGMWNGSEELNIPKIEDRNFREKLSIQTQYWEKLSKDILDLKQAKGEDKKKLTDEVIKESEEYFDMANATVYAAEDYSESLAAQMGILEIILAAVAVGITGLVILDFSDKQNLLNLTQNLGKKAYIDAHTGLPNKSRCEEVFNGTEVVGDNVCCVMFDLNGLKKVNDTLGHVTGDMLIKGFADILKRSVRGNDFIGRYGGDEFAAVIYDAGDNNLCRIFDRIKGNVHKFNEANPGMPLSFAYGYSSACGREGCTMLQLLKEADANMYCNKSDMKKNGGKCYCRM